MYKLSADLRPVIRAELIMLQNLPIILLGTSPTNHLLFSLGNSFILTAAHEAPVPENKYMLVLCPIIPAICSYREVPKIMPAY